MIHLTALLQVLVDVEGNLVPQPEASLLILDYTKLAFFCGLADLLADVSKQAARGGDVFVCMPPAAVALLSRWCDELGPAFWNSADTSWFNGTFHDDFHVAARKELEASSYEPWQYLQWYLRLWRNCVEHKKKASVAASFAHMRTLPMVLQRTPYVELDLFMTELKGFMVVPKAGKR